MNNELEKSIAMIRDLYNGTRGLIDFTRLREIENLEYTYVENNGRSGCYVGRDWITVYFLDDNGDQIETNIDFYVSGEKENFSVEGVQFDLQVYDQYELFDDYIDGMRLMVLNENEKVTIHIENTDGTTNNATYTKEEFLDINEYGFKKIINELNYYSC